MKKLLVLCLAVCLVILCLSGCSDNPTCPCGTEINQRLVVQAGESIAVTENVELTFVGLLGDGRCPIDPVVFCLWQGMATIQIRLTEVGHEPVLTELPILGYVEEDDTAAHIPIRVLDHRLTLVELDPYPREEPPNSDEYVATIIIEDRADDFDPVEPVQITDMTPAGIQVAAFQLNTVYVDADTINLSIFHSGGCREHLYYLFMSPSAFLESYPVQANIYLRHIDNDDPCDAWLSADLCFSLRPIADLYQQFYGGLDPIKLNVHEYNGSDSSRVVQVTYTPEE
jgi:hypothetical protein